MNKNVVLIPLLLLALVPVVVLGSMSNSKAATEAFKIWGAQSYTGTDHPWLQTHETKKIGFLSPGCQSDITIMGKGNNTWDAAFASLPANKGVDGPYGGMMTFKIISPGDDQATTSTVVPGVVIAVQVFIDNVPAGEETPTGNGTDLANRTPWELSIPWDTATVSDGRHVMCAQLIHPDGSFALTHAGMIIVKQAAQP